MAIGDKISWDALRRIGASNPVIKWGVIVIVALYAVEFLGERALTLYKKISIVQGEVAGTNAENEAKSHRMKVLHPLDELPALASDAPALSEKCATRKARGWADLGDDCK
jgi:hypothetical protein